MVSRLNYHMQQRITTKLRANSGSNSSSFETVNRSIATLTVILTPAAVVFALIARVHARKNTRYAKENRFDKKTRLITGKEDGCLVKANGKFVTGVRTVLYQQFNEQLL